MKSLARIAAGALAAAALAGCSQYGSDSGWTTLDTGSLSGWDKAGNANWRVEDGMLVADRGNGFLVTKDTYGDFQLVAEFYVEPESNSGIFIRCQDAAKPTGKTCYEVNIWDRRPVQKYGTGAIVDVAAVDPMPHAGGKWNTYEVTAKGDQFFVTLNGQRTVDGARNGDHSRGLIALQRGDGNKTDKEGIVKFRKVQIRPL